MARTCDRCKAVIEHSDVRHYYLRERVGADGTVVRSDRYDLCPDCGEDNETWWGRRPGGRRRGAARR